VVNDPMNTRQALDGTPVHEQRRSTRADACRRVLRRNNAASAVEGRGRHRSALPSALPSGAARPEPSAAPSRRVHGDRRGEPEHRLLRIHQFQSSLHQTTTRLPTPARPVRAPGLSHGIETTPVVSERAGSPCIIKVRTTAWKSKEATDAVLLAFPASSSPETASAVAACGLRGAQLACEVPGDQYPTSHHGGWNESVHGPSDDPAAGRRAPRARQLHQGNATLNYRSVLARELTAEDAEIYRRPGHRRRLRRSSAAGEGAESV
jgi:hypothetical protein